MAGHGSQARAAQRSILEGSTNALLTKRTWLAEFCYRSSQNFCMNYHFSRNFLLSGLVIAGIAFGLSSCNRNKEPENEKEAPAPAAVPAAPAPPFDANKAYSDVLKQVGFGPRVPNSAAHKKAVAWLDSSLLACTKSVQLQRFTDTGYAKGELLDLTNVIASFNDTATWRILILTHYDSRPWADEDPDPKNQDKPVPAANDAGSGTAVMLELARQMKDHPPPIGVDLFFDDGEDYGKDKVDSDKRFFLGVKYFLKVKQANYNPRFAILLDMVGDSNADFIPEQSSERAAALYVKEIWNQAATLGLSHFHTNRECAIDDDHIPLIQAGIPSVDIIDGDLVGHQSTDPNRKYWHTIDDLPKHISSKTLDEVGKLLLALIYQRLPQDIPVL